MTAAPKTEYTQEVRFAVVMYGGVSLAIYINGITQERLRLVRSTSRPVERLENTERVYRRLSCLLSDQELLRRFRDALDNPTSPTRPDIVDERVAENNVNTRFVVDIRGGYCWCCLLWRCCSLPRLDLARYSVGNGRQSCFHS